MEIAPCQTISEHQYLDRIAQIIATWYNILIIESVPTTQTNPIMKGAIPCTPSKTASSASTWTKRKFSGPTENATPSFLYRCLLRSTP